MKAITLIRSKMMSDINETLEHRGSRYGTFIDNATLCQMLKTVIRQSNAFPSMDPMHIEALDMITHKISRILNGDPNYDDSWRDIAGYAMLVVKELEKNNG
jgi:hypothetical protein